MVEPCWGYKKENGPSIWNTWFPVANSGTRQSPVDIVTNSCVPDSSMKELKYEYDPDKIKLINTGSSWRMDFAPSLPSNLSGGPLDDDYKVLQMHAHWGDCPGRGSEHTLDGKSFDAELHIVHYNTKYGDAGVAVDKPDGLAVLGMFIKTGKHHPAIEKICENLKHVQKKNKTVELQDLLIPSNLLPNDKTFYTYPGSLTTPPLFESVTWIVFKEPIEMSEEQLNAMRELQTEDHDDCDCMVNNYRPPCNLGERTIRVKV